VGRLLSEMLSFDAVDVDAALEQQHGLSAAQIIRQQGEAEFRRLEQKEMDSLLSGSRAVLMPGGGWAAFEDNLARALDRVYAVYLKTSPEIAAARVDAEDGDRPLLAEGDTAVAMEDLLNARRPFYEMCHATVSTDGKTAREVAIVIAELASNALEG